MTTTTQFRGSDVVDPEQNVIGTIDDVMYDAEGNPTWAVVDLGLLRSSHYIPVVTGYLTDSGTFVVPYEKRTVKSAPKAHGAHVLDSELEAELAAYYELAN